MWKCYNCENEFEEPNTLNTTYESFYGVSSEFCCSTPMELLICPFCGKEDISQIYYDEEEDEE